MLRRSAVAALLVATVELSSACGPGADRQASHQAALSPTDVAAIRSADSAFAAAANAGDTDGVAAVYAADATLLPPNLPPQKGRDAVRAFWGGFLNAYMVKFEIASDTIEGRGDLAYNRGHFRFTAVPKSRGPNISDEGKFVEILRKQPDGSWKYIVDMYSSNLPAQR